MQQVASYNSIFEQSITDLISVKNTYQSINNIDKNISQLIDIMNESRQSISLTVKKLISKVNEIVLEITPDALEANIKLDLSNKKLKAYSNVFQIIDNTIKSLSKTISLKVVKEHLKEDVLNHNKGLNEIKEKYESTVLKTKKAALDTLEETINAALKEYAKMTVYGEESMTDSKIDSKINSITFVDGSLILPKNIQPDSLGQSESARKNFNKLLDDLNKIRSGETLSDTNNSIAEIKNKIEEYKGAQTAYRTQFEEFHGIYKN